MPVKKYKTIPAKIYAIQYNGKNVHDLKQFVGMSFFQNSDSGECFISTLEGRMHISVDDYVIRGTAGEFYPCKPDIFEAKYKELNNEINA